MADGTKLVNLTVEIPMDGFVGREEETISVVFPWHFEGMRPDGVAHMLKVGLKTVYEQALQELEEKGFI